MSGDYYSFLAELVRAVERTRPPGSVDRLGRAWDVEGDPAALRPAALWAYVADGVAAYRELTSAESYLGSAADWTDLRRLAALVGFRPRPRVAARGWAVARLDAGASPTVPAGTRMQAPAVPGRPAQVFEVERDTALRADWNRLTATLVPRPAVPGGRTLRFLRDPGFRPGDRVLFVAEEVPVAAPLPGWFGYWIWLLALYGLGLLTAPRNRPVAVAVVEKRADDLGTVVVTFDRDLDKLLAGPTTPYAAYRILDSAGSARRLTKLVHVHAAGNTVAAQQIPLGSDIYGTGTEPLGARHVVLDAALDELSAHRLVAVVDWDEGTSGGCDIGPVTRHRPVDRAIAPGTTARASRLDFTGKVGTLERAALAGRPVTVYVVDRRVVARTYEIPEEIAPGAPARIRVFPAPALVPERIALRLGPDDTGWQIFTCAAAAAQEEVPDEPGTPRGLVLDLAGGPLPAAFGRVPASADLVPIRHGATESGTLGGGDAALPGQEMTVPKGPVAYDAGADGSLTSSLRVRVGGLLWEELPSLHEAGPVDGYETRLAADGTVRVRFGDGVRGNRPATGRGNITETHRAGGGTAGELPAGAIDTLLGSIPGVVGVRGAATSGGADQDDERRIRRLAPGRARAFGRAVSRGDLADLARDVPGVSHAAAWAGAGPPGCGCGGTGEHVAFLRLRAAGRPGPPVPDEIRTLAAYLDARRDPTVPLCVTAAVFTEVRLSCVIAVDPRRLPGEVAAAVRAALTAQDGPLDPLNRIPGIPLDGSDVLSVIHGVTGVLGVPALTLAPFGGERVPARRYELLAVAAEPDVAVLPS